jgi:hypothetical protein
MIETPPWTNILAAASEELLKRNEKATQQRMPGRPVLIELDSALKT